jgi:zinc protease
MMFLAWILAAGAEEPAEVAVEEPSDKEEEAPDRPDRSSPPEVLSSEHRAPEVPVAYALSNGAEVWHVRVPAVRNVVVAVQLGRGSVDLLGNNHPLGSAMGWMMDVATEGHDSTELEILTDTHEISLWSSLSSHTGEVGLSVPGDDLELGMELLGEALRTPAFDKADLKIYQRDLEQYYTTQGPNSPGQVAYSAASWGWIDASHPYGTRPDLAEIARLKSSDLAALHKRWLAESPVHVLVVGDVASEAIQPMLEAALAGVGTTGTVQPDLAVEPPALSRVLAVDMPGQAQVEVHCRFAGPARASEDRLDVWLANWVLGGHFLSRLNANLREEKGLTYGARSRYRSLETRGHIDVHVAVEVENLSVAVAEIKSELERAAKVTPDEVDMSIRRDVSAWNRVLENADSAAGFYGERLSAKETVEDAFLRAQVAAGLTPEQVAEGASPWFSADQARLWVVVGDRAAMEPQLTKLGWSDVAWIEPLHAVRGDF